MYWGNGLLVLHTFLAVTIILLLSILWKISIRTFQKSLCLLLEIKFTQKYKAKTFEKTLKRSNTVKDQYIIIPFFLIFFFPFFIHLFFYLCPFLSNYFISLVSQYFCSRRGLIRIFGCECTRRQIIIRLKVVKDQDRFAFLAEPRQNFSEE